MVVEVKTPIGYMAFATDRLPPILDDEIKKVHADFYKAAQYLTPQELMDAHPMSFPATQSHTSSCVARYPVDDWEASGCPKFSTMSWCKLAMKVAEKDYTSLSKLFEVADKLLKEAVSYTHLTLPTIA